MKIVHYANFLDNLELKYQTWFADASKIFYDIVHQILY